VSDLRAAFDDGPAFVPYLAVGDPDAEASKAYVEALVEGGADVVELGLPFSEPIAEGPTIQGAVARALEGGMTPNRFFEFVESLDVDVPLVCMTYYNLIYQYGDREGPGPFVERAAEAGIDGIIVPDLPVDESDPLESACDAEGLDLVFIVAPTTTDARLERIRAVVSGYVYVQARMGTTGAKADVSDRTAESLARVADWNVPAAVGFGISEREHAREVVAAGADGVIVGSALVDLVAEGVEEELPTDVVADRLAAKARDLATGTREGARGSAAEPEPK
jgi:tryptophan synthase alpha chain